MRFFSELSIFVYLTVALSAADWTSVHEQGLAAVNRGNLAEAETFLRQSAPLARNDLERGLSANDLGVILHQLNRDADARRQLEAAFSTWERLPGAEVRLAQTAEALAAVYRTLGEYAAAENKLRAALKTPPSDDDSHAIVLNELGDILREIGRTNEATELLGQSLGLPGISVRRRLEANLALADLDRDAGRWKSSIDRWNHSEQIAREEGWTALEATAIRGLGITYFENKQPARAEPLLRRALAKFEASNAPRHQTASTLSCLAQLYIGENKLALAEDALLRSIDITEKELSPNHPQLAVLYEMLGETVAARGQFEQARDYYSHARAIMAGHFGDRSAIAAAVDASWALVEQRSKHSAEAAADYEKALAVLDAAGPEVDPLRTTVHQHYQEVCKALHRKPSISSDSFKAQSFRPASR
jgi:tetratricopeptide (TPR) repeat protein